MAPAKMLTSVPPASTQRSGRRLERWLLVSSVGILPLNQAVRPWPTPSCNRVAVAEASTAMLTIVVLLCPSDIRITLSLPEHPRGVTQLTCYSGDDSAV